MFQTLGFPIANLPFELILAAEPNTLAQSMLMAKLALTIIGLGILLVGAVLFFYKPKDESKRSSFAARLTGGISFGVIGIGTICLAWLWYEKLVSWF